MSKVKTIRVPHLGGIDAGYQMPHPYDDSKPTLVLVNSFTTDSELYQKQFQSKELTDAMNLISIELLGHGQTRTRCRQFTYWGECVVVQVCSSSIRAGRSGRALTPVSLLPP